MFGCPWGASLGEFIMKRFEGRRAEDPSSTRLITVPGVGFEPTRPVRGKRF